MIWRGRIEASDVRSSRVSCDTGANSHWLSRHPSLAMHEYPLVWMCMQPEEPVKAALPEVLMLAARWSLVTLLVLTMGPDEPRRCAVRRCRVNLPEAGRTGATVSGHPPSLVLTGDGDGSVVRQR